MFYFELNRAWRLKVNRKQIYRKLSTFEQLCIKDVVQSIVGTAANFARETRIFKQ